MTTFIFILLLFLGSGTLIYQHRSFEKEKCAAITELCVLLESMEREVASLPTHPTFCGVGESCPYLVRQGVIDALAKASDIGACMCERLVELPICEEAGELLVGYFSTFGHGERSTEYQGLSHLLTRLRALAEEERELSKKRERAFDVTVACCALCAAIAVI